jgi:hypothetical protein
LKSSKIAIRLVFATETARSSRSSGSSSRIKYLEGDPLPLKFVGDGERVMDDVPDGDDRDIGPFRARHKIRDRDLRKG